MNEHYAFLRLAATAVDFPLDAAERDGLGRHIDGCDSCRRAADSFRRDAAALRSLPRRSPSPHVTAAIMRAARGETRRRRPPLLLLGLGFLLVVGAAGAIVGGGPLRQLFVPQPPPNNVPTPAPTAAVVLPSGPPPSIDPRLGVEWQIVDSVRNGADSATATWAVTPGGPGFVAVGRTCLPELPDRPLDCWGTPQLSSTGSKWVAVPRQHDLEIGAIVPIAGPWADMFGVAAGPDGVVAIGYAVDGTRLHPALWFSRDAQVWERIPNAKMFDGARFKDIVATDDGFVVVGVVYGPRPPAGQPRGAIWTSRDGRSWQRVPDSRVFDIGGYMDTGEDPGSGGPRRVVSGAGLIVAAGDMCNENGTSCGPAFWSSSDGSTWTRAVLDAPDVTANDVVVTPGGFVAVGSAANAGGCSTVLRCTAIVFTSPDAQIWERHSVAIPGGLNVPDAFTDAIVIGGRIFAISQELDGQRQAPPGEPTIDNSGAGFWSSPDGLTWAPVEGIPPDFNPSPYQPIAATPDRIVIVGDVNARIAVSPKD